jgi:rubrerythrin
LKRNCLFLICFFFCSQFVFAKKIDCEIITSLLIKIETQIEHLNLQDPDYIPLHYLLAKDIITELNQFKKEVISFFSECSTITFSELINRYDELNNLVRQKHDSLEWLSRNVHLIYYEKALYEYKLNNEEDAKYFLDRTLQYNETFPDAILLKLNKLLEKNYFEDCLSLLKTLYHEAELNRVQEMQAIEFTDKFYDKLYKTGDSLVKMEHAAEALKLFEILEIFCLNLPSAYCNDDYYHGVMRSKSGIFESYLTIAKVAEKRKNPKVAEHFYQYAIAYLEANPHLENYVPTIVADVTSVTSVTDVANATDVSEIKKVQEFKSSIIQEVLTDSDEVVPKLSSTEIKEKYDGIVIQAIALCIKENFSESYRLFLKAKKLEDCNCFVKDFRVDLMLKELSRIIN